MHTVSFILGGLTGGLAMHVCLALEAHASKRANKRLAAQARQAVNAWLVTVDDYLKLRIGECEQPVAMQNRHNHVHEMMKLQGVLNEAKL